MRDKIKCNIIYGLSHTTDTQHQEVTQITGWLHDANAYTWKCNVVYFTSLWSALHELKVFLTSLGYPAVSSNVGWGQNIFSYLLQDVLHNTCFNYPNPFVTYKHIILWVSILKYSRKIHTVTFLFTLTCFSVNQFFLSLLHNFL